jgi:hypothetical protein
MQCVIIDVLYTVLKMQDVSVRARARACVCACACVCVRASAFIFVFYKDTILSKPWPKH